VRQGRWRERPGTGGCVYDCDNGTWSDHQVVAMEFVGGATATFTMTAFSTPHARPAQPRIFGHPAASSTATGIACRSTTSSPDRPRSLTVAFAWRRWRRSGVGDAGTGHGGGMAASWRPSPPPVAEPATKRKPILCPVRPSRSRPTSAVFAAEAGPRRQGTVRGLVTHRGTVPIH